MACMGCCWCSMVLEMRLPSLLLLLMELRVSSYGSSVRVPGKFDLYYCQWRDAGMERCRKVRRTKVRTKMLRVTGLNRTRLDDLKILSHF
ncbi:hypothetical protein F5148DRAFT_1161469 [Russula earlei]|uniref:Uncharacterized protein n=1 Tax=Russula earlei TaxID=71964 RepID=A0ACC0UNW1_9AGAM|nr:hypothetical protein F5148DRAFT_1161469 [Russula earlei]